MPNYILKDDINDHYKVLNTHKNNTSVIFFKKKLFFRKFSKSKQVLKKLKQNMKVYNGTVEEQREKVKLFY